jgi:hypothetical protein
MAITTDAAALEAKYAGKMAVTPPPPLQDLYFPGSGTAPNKQGQVPTGTPIAEGQFISQIVGRGMAVVPPQQQQTNQPQIAIIPPQQSSRTTIGTIIEPSKTNPLVDALPKLPEPPKVETPAKPERKLDLGALILESIWEMGGSKSEEAQKYYDRSHDTLEKWMHTPALIPLGAILKFMQRTPGIKDVLLEELEPHFSADAEEGSITSLPTRTKTSVMVCTAVLDRPTLPYTTALAYLMKKYEAGFTFQSDTMIGRSRNMLAKRFLESNCTWSLWLDSDMAPPIANPDWYRWITNCAAVPNEYCAYDVLGRLLSQAKAVIGGVYASRKWHGSLVIQPEINPRTPEDRLLCNEIRRGTARGLAEVEWIGFGCALVHREVFLEVQRNFPQLRPQTEYGPWRYFQVEGDEGEDEAFCRRVRACAIPIWLDTQLVCGHVGSQCFLPEHTQSLPGL